LVSEALKEEKEVGLQSIRKGGVPVEGRGEGVKGSMVVDVSGKEMFHGGLNTVVKEGGLGLGVEKEGEEVGGELLEGSKFVREKRVGEGGVAKRLAEDANAGGAFSRGGKESKCVK
jgi:hypothetical protein